MDIKNTKPFLSTDMLDFFGGQIMSEGSDPQFDRIALIAPQCNSWDFVGTETSKWKYLISDTGVVTIETTVMEESGIDYRKEVARLFDPALEGFTYAGIRGEQGLLDGWLPVDVIEFKTQNGVYKQEAFVWSEKNSNSIFIKVSSPENAVFFEIEEPQVSTREELLELEYIHPQRTIDSNRYESSLISLRSKWNDFFSDTLEIIVPDERIMNCAKNSIIKAIHSSVGDAVHYGVTRYFCDTARNAESFAPTTIYMVDCCVEYGLFDKARRSLAYFIENFVTDDGELLHRGNGASISEHGMLLSSFAKYVRYSGDDLFNDTYINGIKRICDLLLRKREQGKKNSRQSGRYGLIKGCPEDDVRSWNDDYWYSGNCWAVRGLKEIGLLLSINGDTAFSNTLLQEVEAFKVDVISSIESCVSADFVPPYPGCPVIHNFADKIFYGNEKKDNLLLSAYSNYRFYPEMLSSGVLPMLLCDKIIKYRERHGGEFLGMIKMRFGDEFKINNWPIFNYLTSLIVHGERNKFLMTLYAHMAYHQSRNTFFAPESTTLEFLDSIYCVPAQLTVPLSLRRMLIHEDVDLNILNLCKAIPLLWLRYEEGVKVKSAPTYWGELSFSLAPRKEGFLFEITLPEKDSPDAINLCIPNIKNVNTIHPSELLEIHDDKIVIIPREIKRIEIRVSGEI